jgi:hypothetical protein
MTLARLAAWATIIAVPIAIVGIIVAIPPKPAPQSTPQPVPQPAGPIKKATRPKLTPHDADMSGIRYHVTWSVDANCTEWQKGVGANVKVQDGHSCDFTRTQVKIGESGDPFDHWNIAVQAPSDVYDVDCQKGLSQLFEDETDGENNRHKGVPEGTWGRCTGYINGGDNAVTVTAYYRVLR